MATSDPSFVPSFCPSPECRHHRDPSGWKWRRDGTFRRLAAPHVIRRFRCMQCRRRFSSQSFDTTYWLRRPELQRPLVHALVSCCALRQAGRALGAAHSTIQRQASRLGRHCLLFQRVRGPSTVPEEPLVLDGFETFEYSQYWPFDLNLLVGARSQFLYGFTHSELRRSGRMTPFQKRRRSELEASFLRPDPNATANAVRKLVEMVAPAGGSLLILSDEHLAYPRAFKGLAVRIDHRRFSSRRCRTRRNPLHPVDHLDLLLRHSSANHKRETIAFSKRCQGALERAAVFQVWRNFIKRTSERRPLSPTPAQHLDLTTRPLDLDDLLSRRLMPSRVDLPDVLAAIYSRTIRTRQLPDATTHDLRYAA